MTENARRILNDCRACLQMLEDEENETRWRVLRAAALALIRSVGHALDKVDGSSVKNESHKIFAQWKATKPEPRIFWEFIDAQRNLVLKEYRHETHIAESISVYVDRDGQPFVPRDFSSHIAGEQCFALEGVLYRPNTMAFRFGEDFRDTYQEAIDFWEEQILPIEKRIATP